RAFHLLATPVPDERGIGLASLESEARKHIASDRLSRAVEARVREVKQKDAVAAIEGHVDRRLDLSAHRIGAFVAEDGTGSEKASEALRLTFAAKKGHHFPARRVEEGADLRIGGRLETARLLARGDEGLERLAGLILHRG